jgi:DNA-binding response OmpR family regulator
MLMTDRPLSCLLIDDNPDVLDGMAHQLRLNNFDVQVASSLADLQKALSPANKLDVVLVDFHLDGMPSCSDSQYVRL